MAEVLDIKSWFEGEEETVPPVAPPTVDISEVTPKGMTPSMWTDGDDEGYKEWYSTNQKRWGLDPDPAREEEWYDFKSAYKAGVAPDVDLFGQMVWPRKYQIKRPKKLMRYKKAVDSEKTPTPEELEAHNAQLKGPEIQPEDAEVVSLEEMLLDQELEQMSMANPKYWLRVGEQVLRSASEGASDMWKLPKYRKMAETLEGELAKPFEMDPLNAHESVVFNHYMKVFKEANDGKAPTNEQWQRMRALYEMELKDMSLENIQKWIDWFPKTLPGSTGLFEDMSVLVGRFGLSMGVMPVSMGGSFLMNALQIGGMKSEELVAQGIDYETAVQSGLSLGLMQGAVEMMGNKALYKVVGKLVGKVYGKNPIAGRLVGLLTAMGASAYTEGLEEFIQQNQEVVFNYVMANPDMTPGEVLAWMGDNIPALFERHKGELAEAAGIGAGAGAFMAALIGGGKLTLQSKAMLEEYKIHRETAPLKKIVKGLKKEAKRQVKERAKQLEEDVKPTEEVSPAVAIQENQRRAILRRLVAEGKITKEQAIAQVKYYEKAPPPEQYFHPDTDKKVKKEDLTKTVQELSMKRPGLVKGPAIRIEGKIYPGLSHSIIAEEQGRKLRDIPEEDQGFVTPRGKYLDRVEAAKLVGLNADIDLPPLYTQRLATEDLKALDIKETEGEGGVRRFSYTVEGKEIGTARMLGTTIGDIDVGEEFQKQGYGTQILQDLKSKGGTTLTAVSEGGKALALSMGMKDLGKGRFSFDKDLEKVDRMVREELQAGVKLPTFTTMREAAVAGVKATPAQIAQVNEDLTSLEIWARGKKGKALVAAEAEIALYKHFLEVTKEPERYAADLEAVGEKVEPVTPPPTKEEAKTALIKRIEKLATGLKKKNVEVGRGPHTKNFVVSVGEKSGTIYGLAKKGDEKVVRTKIHPLYGEMEVTEYFRTIDGVKYKVLKAGRVDQGILSRNSMVRKLDKLDEGL
jgi:hypothetical protein